MCIHASCLACYCNRIAASKDLTPFGCMTICWAFNLLCIGSDNICFAAGAEWGSPGGQDCYRCGLDGLGNRQGAEGVLGAPGITTWALCIPCLCSALFGKEPFYCLCHGDSSCMLLVSQNAELCTPDLGIAHSAELESDI